jgi:hypothetical protein
MARAGKTRDGRDRAWGARGVVETARRAIQSGADSLRAVSERCGGITGDGRLVDGTRTCPRVCARRAQPRRASPAEDVAIAALRACPPAPLDDRHRALQPAIPHPTPGKMGDRRMAAPPPTHTRRSRILRPW